MTTDRKIFKIWRNGIPCQSVYLNYARPDFDVESLVKRAAEQAAINESREIDVLAWPAKYQVLDPDGKLWIVFVDRVTRPTYATVRIGEADPMRPLIHVLWEGSVACSEPRVSGVPKSWPEGQTWMSRTEFLSGAKVAGEICEECADATRKAAR